MCPSCGSKYQGDLRLGCPACGACAVGPPLAKPEHALPSYSQALIVAAGGALMCVGLLTTTLAALMRESPISLEFRSLVAAGETAAWRLKWIVPPLAITTFWIGLRTVKTIRFAPGQYAGMRIARSGLMVSAVVSALVASLIGITIPERLRQRRAAIDAAYYAQGYTIQLALLEYRELHKTFPADLKDLRDLPDPDGAIAQALRNSESIAYSPSAVVASASTKTKPQVLRGGALRNAATGQNTDPLPGVSFTDYDLRLPGESRVLGSDDDLVLHDGVILKVSELPPQAPAISSRPNVP